MNIDALLHPQISDREALQDFSDALSDHLVNVERDVGKLQKEPHNKLVTADLFRTFHTIKGDAGMCKVELAVMILHPIESVLSRVRDGELTFSDPLAEAIMLAMDRLELAVHAIEKNESIDQLKLVELVKGLESLIEATPSVIDVEAGQVIKAVTGFQMSSKLTSAKASIPATARSAEIVLGDLRFFRTLALQYEMLSPLFKGRSERQLHLALETNRLAGTLVDPLQLEAAVYMHDVGMMFLPEAIWLSTNRLSDEEKNQLKQHCVYSSGLLERMEGWQQAAAIVLQHHERQDGAGYPHGLKSENIEPGAKLMAIIDTFESVTLKHSQRGQGRSLVRAIAEVNAGNDQFAPEWITPFNIVIRRMIEE